MRRHLLALLVCVLLCLMVLPGTASADSGPKPAVTITVVNAPAGEYYLDLLVTDPGDHANIDPADYDPNLLQGLRDWEVDGWYPALAGGTSVPLFGDLRPGEDGTHRFTYYGLPRAFRIAVSGPDGVQATDEPFTRTVFYTHLTYDWETNSITRATSPAGFYGVQFLSTLVPTLLVEGGLLWLFGFRARRDWLVFLVAEVPILLVELIAYVFLLKEYSGLRRAAYAACANIASYAVGYLPLHWAVEFLAR